MNSEIIKLERERMSFAFEKVKKVQSTIYSKEFNSYVKDFPMLLLNNHLPNTFAFVSMNGQGDKASEKAYREIWSLCFEWLKKRPVLKDLIGNDPDNEITLKKLAEINLVQSGLIAIELDALFIWLRRFADGLIQVNMNSGIGIENSKTG